MNSSTVSPLHKALYRLLRPLLRIVLRNGMAYGEFNELVKRAYVDVALNDLAPNRKKPTDSHAAVLTGLTRKEVKRLREWIQNADEPASVPAQGRADRVVSGWVNDADFHDDQGEPAILPFDGPISFSTLVKRYSGDMPARALGNELCKQGVAQEDSNGWTLLKKAYIPLGDDSQLLRIFGSDVSAMLTTIDHNLTAAQHQEGPRFQRTVAYTKIPRSALPEWNALAHEEAQALLLRLNAWLAARDADVTGETPAEPLVRLGLSIFALEEASESDASNEP